MPNKLQQARARRNNLIQQEFSPSVVAELVRRQLRAGETPDNWNDGLFAPIEETLPDPFFFLPMPDGHLQPIIFWDYAWLGIQHTNFPDYFVKRDIPDEEQCKIDALRLRRQFGFSTPSNLE